MRGSDSKSCDMKRCTSPLSLGGRGVEGEGDKTSNTMNRDPLSIERARNLRRETTPTERILWKHLRGRLFDGFRFCRQHPIGPFVVDFCCLSKRLVIELDGETHIGREQQDKDRSRWLEARGCQILRFWNTEIFEDLDSVLEVVYLACQKGPPHPYPLSLQGRGERANNLSNEV